MLTRITLVIALACFAGLATSTSSAQCYSGDCESSSGGCRGGGCLACRQAPYLHHAQLRASQYNWHGNYNHSAYGQPVALVVPPTANLQTNWSWGAPSSRISRIDHQFGRDYPGPGPFGGSFRNTPVWPADTAQFGVYYARGPWYPIQR